MRFAIIGTNFITERFLQAAKKCSGFTLGMVYSRSPQTGQAFAEKWGASEYTTSLFNIAENKDIDTVYIASPNSLHVQQTLQMLQAKKHVLCEKPIAPTAADFAQMQAVAAQNNVLLLEAMRPAFMPSLAVLQQTIAQIGPVRHANISYCQYSSRYDKFKQGIVENAFNPAFCNGALMDIGVYCVHMMVMLFGVPQDICAKGWFLPKSIDAAGTAICTYPDMHVQITYSKVHQSNSPAEIQGENGTLFFAPTATPYKAWIEYRNGTKQELTLAVDEEDMRYELEAFMRLAATPQSCTQRHTWSAQALGVMDEMRRQIGIQFAEK